MIRLSEGVYTWSAFNLEKKFNFNGFLFCGAGRCLVVDPPPMSSDDRAYWQTLSLKPELVVITNRNHLRARAEWAAPTALHEAEAGEVDFTPDRLLKEGEQVGPGLRVVHLPGKSPGEIGLHWKERGILMLGDALIAPKGALALIPEAKMDDPALLRLSLRKLEPLAFDTLLVGDGDPVLGGAKALVGAFVRGL